MCLHALAAGTCQGGKTLRRSCPVSSRRPGGDSARDRYGAYAPVAVLYCSTTPAGTRPRSLTSMPCPLAHSRTLAVSTVALPRRARAVLLAVPPARRACARYSLQCLAELVAVRGAEVDLVFRAVQAEADGAGRLAAVEVINQQRLNSLGHEKTS